jgi:hypothetical protein
LGNPFGNFKGTCWEQRKKEKKKASLLLLLLAPPPPKLKRKKSMHFECMLSLPIGWHEISISKTVHHHFWPGLIPLL